MNKMQLSFSLATVDDLSPLQKLFADSILAVCNKDYSNEQVSAWATGAHNTERWLQRLDEQYFLLAWFNQHPVGFCTLSKNGYLDLLYVHKNFQRHGIASQLYQQIEMEAMRQGFTGINTDASITARPFFEKQGFNIVREQTVNINGVSLTNFKMYKRLIPS